MFAVPKKNVSEEDGRSEEANEAKMEESRNG